MTQSRSNPDALRLDAAPLLVFTGDSVAQRVGHVTSQCKRYTISWSHDLRGKPYFNAWYGDSPRKHLTGTFDKELAKTACEQHARKQQEQAA